MDYNQALRVRSQTGTTLTCKVHSEFARRRESVHVDARRRRILTLGKRILHSQCARRQASTRVDAEKIE
jgi:hypothetical protein